ncbi:hypothetical protein [uncultured Psychroserpens sp.]|uniref:hypothetical protein n=1 Tax=uncultured Psychroserpens sp. TaxID=255436 RepID=UPI0026228EEA|nr:hypothetical protein [uncultured Psychroserpens sp.]
MNKLIFIIIILSTYLSFGQKSDSLSLKIDYGVKSEEFQDYLLMKHIDFYKVKVSDKNLKDKSFTIISKEYWNKNLTKTDTIINLSNSARKITNDSLKFNIITEKTDKDSLQIYFSFKGLFSTTRKFKTTEANNYSARDLSNGIETKFEYGNSFPLIVYSLPYKNPKYPGYLFYCELSREGIPPEQWGEKFNLEHYIIFEMKFE